MLHAVVPALLHCAALLLSAVLRWMAHSPTIVLRPLPMVDTRLSTQHSGMFENYRTQSQKWHDACTMQ